MRSVRTFIGAIALVSGVALFQPSSAATLLNGDFEAGDVNWGSFGAGDTSFLTETGGVGGSRGYVLNAGGAPRSVGIHQTVSDFVIGHEYRVDVAVANFAPQFGTVDGLNFGVFAELAGGVVGATTSSGALGIDNLVGVFAPFSFQFTADATSIDLRFLAQIADDRSFTIDNVVLTDLDDGQVVPLPAALPLLATGLGAFWLVGRRRRRAV